MKLIVNFRNKLTNTNMKAGIALFFVLTFIDCRAQKIEDVTATQEDNSILVSYSLVDNSLTPDFHISLFCSGDGGTSWHGPLVSVSGDVGQGVLASRYGSRKHIKWDVLKKWDYLYGDNIKFRVDAGFKDHTEFLDENIIIDLRDSSIYKVVTIGDNMWMAENLRFEVKGGGSVCYDNDPENCIKYGRLYNWTYATKVCPRGWHLPSHDEMLELTEIAGGKDLGARKLKSVEGWQKIRKKMMTSKTPVFSNNETGFNAIPAGSAQGFNNRFWDEGLIAYFWTSTKYTKYSETYIYSLYLVHSRNSVHNDHIYDEHNSLIADKRSVRCIKDKQD